MVLEYVATRLAVSLEVCVSLAERENATLRVIESDEDWLSATERVKLDFVFTESDDACVSV